MTKAPTLHLRGDELWAEVDQGARAVRLVCARPLSDPGRHISVVDAESRAELGMLDSLDDLDEASREIARGELYRSYCVAVVRRILEGRVRQGQRFVKVETDRGERFFNLKEPGKNVTSLAPDGLVIRDSMGNRYLIPSLAGLDPESRRQLDQVL